MKRDQTDRHALYANGVRRDAWRAELLHEELAEKAAARRASGRMRWAIAAGFVLGLVGSYFTHLA
ncbi:hypothetical protein [Terricaulis silvestris]|uniref:Uncharacterized protein n=1 Tax=Terricaulis silvestris TaxID=2686094 RepID=A0A6I6MNV7_9CAUL|nr:hypothetical protein [Terricaulis silvestris]QGZ96379.1 hypothetical protein DSM104635_03238 [Terricaulis silvestris]